ncbi:hypothetical protein STZ1_11042 [Bacillus subtilis]
MKPDTLLSGFFFYNLGKKEGTYEFFTYNTLKTETVCRTITADKQRIGNDRKKADPGPMGPILAAGYEHSFLTG